MTFLDAAAEEVAPRGAQRGAPSKVDVGPPINAYEKDGQLAQLVTQRWKDGQDALARQRRSYWQNLAFFLGYHWVWWSETHGSVMPLRQDYSPLGPGRSRLTVNKFAANLVNVMGRLLKRELPFEVTPSDVVSAVVEGAKLAEHLLEGQAKQQGWELVRFDALFAAMLGGVSAVVTEWDPMAGQVLEWDLQTNQAKYGTGDVRLDAFNANEFALEPNVRRATDSRYGIVGTCLPAAYLRDKYQLSWMPRADAYTTDTQFQGRLASMGGHDRGRNLTLALTYYEPPSRFSRLGTYACVLNGVCVHRSEWPLPFDELNFTTFRSKRIDGRWAGDTFLNDAVPIQVAYNHARSVIAEHMKLAGNARLAAPMGAIDPKDLRGRPGDILWWSPDGTGAMPQYLSPPNLPRWLTQEADQLGNELDEIMQVHEISRGVGFSRASASALSLLAEQDDSALGTIVFEQKHGWERVASQVLRIYGGKVPETRRVKIRAAAGIAAVYQWNGKALMDQYDVSIPLDAVTPRTQAASMANAKDLWDRKIITDPRVYARMSGLPPDQFEQLLDVDAAKANRENLRMAMGVVEIPDTRDDNAIHMTEHRRFVMSDTYKYADPSVQALFDDHMKMHEQLEHEQVAQQIARAQTGPQIPGIPQADRPDTLPLPESQAVAMANQPPMPGAGGGGQALPPMPSFGGGAPAVAPEPAGVG